MSENPAVARANRAIRPRTVPPRAVPQTMRNLGLSYDSVRGFEGFGYNKTFASIALSSSGSVTFQFQQDSVFELQRIGALVWQGAAFVGQTLPPLDIQINDTGSGANLFDAAVPLHTIAYLGTGLVFDLPTPRYFRGNSALQATITNNDSANAYVVRLSLHGRKLFF